jgi:hypothetical protein
MILREFNIAGPCKAQLHYMIDAARRLPDAPPLIEGGKYFMIHAARQSGKTTCLQDLIRRLNAQANYYALYCTLEKLQGIIDPEKAIPEIIDCMIRSLASSGIPHADTFGKDAAKYGYASILEAAIGDYCKKLDKPFVILFDEADCLSEGTLISFLRQLRAGYIERSPAKPFPHSVALVGMRQIRDYIAQVRPDRQTLGSASPFNIITDALTLINFTRDEVAALYAQHTAATGQVFEEDAIDLVYRQTQGQPWLVNAIAREVIVKILRNNHSLPITSAHIKEAIQRIILNRPTHLDSLMARLREPRVRRVIEPMLMGELVTDLFSDDFLYTRDLGLIRLIDGCIIEPANPIYAEVIIRTLSGRVQVGLASTGSPYQLPRYLRDGHIDVDYLLDDFRRFWREDSEMWTAECGDYSEAAVVLVLCGFLQRVANGEGRVIREMGTGRGRMDLCILYKDHRYPIEVKVCRASRDSLETIIERGIAQTARYMDTLACKKGWLLIFDKRPSLSWDEKQFRRQATVPPSSRPAQAEPATAGITILGT